MPRPRNPDGTIRAANRAATISSRYLIARWVEAETYAQRLLGIDYKAIAQAVARAARGEIQPAVPLPAVTFPASYSIQPQAIARAYKRALSHIPKDEVERQRTEDNLRSDKLWLSLQSGLLNGDAYAVSVGVSVLDHKAKVNGYCAPKQVNVDAKVEAAAGEPEEPGDSREFQIAVLRALSDRERRIIEKLMDRARERAKQIMASDRALKVGGTLPEPSTEP